jgi:hypothetical protein
MAALGGDATLPEPRPGDRALLDRLAGLRRETEPPPELTARILQAFELRQLDIEIAALVFDSDDTAESAMGRELMAVRRSSSANDARRLVFETAAERLALELTVTTVRGRLRLEGQVLPIGGVSVEVRNASALTPVFIESDPLGGFVVEEVEPGPIRVVCRRDGEDPVASEWLLLS